MTSNNRTNRIGTRTVGKAEGSEGRDFWVKFKLICKSDFLFRMRKRIDEEEKERMKKIAKNLEDTLENPMEETCRENDEEETEKSDSDKKED